MRDSKSALLDFEKAIKLSPLSAHVYFNRANLFASLHIFDKALADYSKCKPFNHMKSKSYYFILKIKIRYFEYFYILSVSAE